ncbi:MAG: energy transducer TonB [Chitinophagaceae bacterium]
MKSIYIAVCILCSLNSYAQKIEKYFDYQWKETEPNAARFYALIEKTDSGWHRRDYFIHERKLQMDGTYEDSNCKIENGLFYFFYANGELQSAGKYVHGKKQGPWLSFHANKLMNDSTVYENGNPVGTSISWYANGIMSDSAQWNNDGSGVKVSWFENGSVSAAGRYSAGEKLNGKWQFFHKNGRLSSLETYKDSVLVDKEYYDEEGNLTDTTNKDREATFPAGNKAWQQYLGKHLYFPSQYKIENADKAIVVVDAIIDEEGNVTNVQVSVPLYPAFDQIAVNAVSKSPKWLPAIQHNRRVQYFVRQPVAFAQQ